MRSGIFAIRRDASQKTSCTTSSKSESSEPSKRAATAATYPEYLSNSASNRTGTRSTTSVTGGAKRRCGLEIILPENDRTWRIRSTSAPWTQNPGRAPNQLGWCGRMTTQGKWKNRSVSITFSSNLVDCCQENGSVNHFADRGSFYLHDAYNCGSYVPCADAGLHRTDRRPSARARQPRDRFGTRQHRDRGRPAAHELHRPRDRRRHHGSAATHERGVLEYGFGSAGRRVGPQSRLRSRANDRRLPVSKQGGRAAEAARSRLPVPDRCRK